MAGPDYQTPDLASVLETLRAYAPPQAPSASVPPLQHPTTTKADLEEGEYDPSSYDPALLLPITPQSLLHPTQLSAPETQHQQHPNTQPPPTPTLHKIQPPDPTNTTTWPPALRHIIHLIRTFPTFTASIRHLIATQHTHERQWHASRLALQKQLSTREASRSKLDSVLSSLGGVVQKRDGQAEIGGKEMSKEEELMAFDRKVWRAQEEMGRGAERELGRLGVPFFGGGKGKGEGGREGLGDLRGRMLQLLDDLCGGDE